MIRQHSLDAALLDRLVERKPEVADVGAALPVDDHVVGVARGDTLEIRQANLQRHTQDAAAGPHADQAAAERGTTLAHLLLLHLIEHRFRVAQCAAFRRAPARLRPPPVSPRGRT